MPEIIPLQPEQVTEVKRMIYTVAHDLFHDELTVEETIAHYSKSWPLADIDDYQHRYCENGGVFLVMVDANPAGDCLAENPASDDRAENRASDFLADHRVRDGQRIIGSGAFKRLEEGVCEIKRLWFLPEYQGRGLGYRMMQALLDKARQMGYTTVRLETSPDSQPRAYAFYHQIGFYDIPRYGDDPDDVGMEMKL